MEWKPTRTSRSSFRVLLQFLDRAFYQLFGVLITQVLRDCIMGAVHETAEQNKIRSEQLVQSPLAHRREQVTNEGLDHLGIKELEVGVEPSSLIKSIAFSSSKLCKYGISIILNSTLDS